MRNDQQNGRERLFGRSVKEIRGYKKRMKLMTALLGMLLVLTALLFVVSALYTQSGSFTVSVNKVDMTKYGLSLSESAASTQRSSQLNAKISEGITNITSHSLPSNLDQIDGAHNGENYIAYTYYLHNAGEVAVPCEYAVNMSNISSGLDEAIRLRLYVNGEPTTYAKTKRDGSGAEPGTTSFYSSTVMAKGRVESLAPGGVVKFTVVLWIEGSDPDCQDTILGGQLKAEMNVNIVH
jgi:hypothetical protein